jgi:hypothetical protein
MKKRKITQSERALRKLVSQCMSAGAKAARSRKPITECPYGPCRGAEDEFHPDIQISSWVLGYMEAVISKSCRAYLKYGLESGVAVDPEQTYGVAWPAPTNPRVRDELIAGFAQSILINTETGYGDATFH